LKLKAGMIEVNGQGLAAGVFFGGIKDSGRAREGGVWGIEEFLESKAMSGWKKSA
jgi:aldehyde dehydrogenase (NAD+)